MLWILSPFHFPLSPSEAFLSIGSFLFSLPRCATSGSISLFAFPWTLWQSVESYCLLSMMFKYIKENTEDHKENKLYRNMEKSHNVNIAALLIFLIRKYI